MLKLGPQRDLLSVIDDQIVVPTGADLLADFSAFSNCAGVLWARRQRGLPVFAAGATSWFSYARSVISWASDNGSPVKVAGAAIRPIARPYDRLI